MQENQREFSIIKGRILQYLEHKGITKYAFYQSTGTTNGILSQSNGISEENLLRFLANYKDINLTWLMRGEGEMVLTKKCRSEVSASENSTRTTPCTTGSNGATPYLPEEGTTRRVADLTAEYTPNTTAETCINLQTIPLYDASADFASMLRGTGHYKPLCLLTLPGVSDCDGAIRIDNNITTPTLQSGDILLYKVCDIPGAIQWCETYLIVLDTPAGETVRIGQLLKAADQEHIFLTSSTPEHTPLKIPVHSIRALALIRATIRYNTL